MDETRLRSLAEELLVFAGCIAEDLGPVMVSGGRDRGRLRADVVILRRAAERLAILAQAAGVLLDDDAAEPGDTLAERPQS